MKQFENKVTEIDIPVDEKQPKGETRKATYADLIVQALKAFSLEGYSVDEMKKRFRIIDVLEPLQTKAKGSAKIEDADVEHLQKTLKAFKWQMVHRDIVEMTDYVSNLKPAK